MNYNYFRKSLLDILAQQNIGDIKSNTITYAPQKNKTNIIVDFWFNKQVITVNDFWLGNFESDYISEWLACECHTSAPVMKAAMRCIAGILSGYQIRIYPEEIFKPWRCICARSFNQYVIRRYKYIGTGELWTDNVAQKRFCRQLPDTDYNRDAISQIEYGCVNNNDCKTWGLKLKQTSTLLSQLPLLLLGKEIYEQTKKIQYYRSGIGYRTYHISPLEFQEAILLIYAILLGLQYQEPNILNL